MDTGNWISLILGTLQTLILLFGLSQLIILKKQEAAQTTIALCNRLFELNLKEIEHFNLFKALDKKEFEELKDSHPEIEDQLKHYMFTQCNLYEEMYFLRDSSNVELRESWQERFVNLLKNKNKLNDYWHGGKNGEKGYQGSEKFRKHINQLLEKAKK